MAGRRLSDYFADEAGNATGGDGYEVRVYESDSAVLAATFLDSALTIALANPLRLNPGTETTVRVAPAVGDVLLDVVSTTGFAVGDVVMIRGGGVTKQRTVRAIVDADTLQLDSAIGTAFAIGSVVGGEIMVGHWQAWVADTMDYSSTVKNVATGVEGPRKGWSTLQTAAVVAVQDEGAAVGSRGTINYIGEAVQAVDNAGSNRVDVTINDRLQLAGVL